MDEHEKPSLVIFDWDNTLVDSFALLHRSYNAMLAHFDKPIWDEAEARKGIRLSAKDSFPDMFGADNFDEAMRVFYQEIDAHHLQETHAIAGAKTLLAHLKTAQIPACVFSNKTDRLLNPEIDHMGWRHFFQASIGATSVSRAKPDPEGILLLCAQLGIQPDAAVWYVGDTENDMRAAKAAGVMAIYVANDPMNSIDEVMEAGADRLYASTQDLLESCLLNA